MTAFQVWQHVGIVTDPIFSSHAPIDRLIAIFGTLRLMGYTPDRKCSRARDDGRRGSCHYKSANRSSAQSAGCAEAERIPKVVT
jgi:hypothetical protein